MERGVPPVPNVVIECPKKPPVILAFEDMRKLYEGEVTFALYGIPSYLQRAVMRMVCKALGVPYSEAVYQRVRTYRIEKPKYEIVPLKIDVILERLEEAKPEERMQLYELLGKAVDDTIERLREVRKELEKMKEGGK